jgi:type IV secretory pathway protease TraF
MALLKPDEARYLDETVERVEPQAVFFRNLRRGLFELELAGRVKAAAGKEFCKKSLAITCQLSAISFHLVQRAICRALQSYESGRRRICSLCLFMK